MQPDYIAIGERIRAARKKCGITQEALADIVDITPGHVSHIERGTTKISLPTIIAVANALGTSVDSLLYDNINITYDTYVKDFKDLLSDCTSKDKELILQSAIQTKAVIKSVR